MSSGMGGAWLNLIRSNLRASGLHCTIYIVISAWDPSRNGHLFGVSNHVDCNFHFWRIAAWIPDRFCLKSAFPPTDRKT